MKQHTRRFVIVVVLVAILLAIPASALASKRIWYARLTTGAELHEVAGSQASGNATFLQRPDSMYFFIRVLGLSGQPTGVHLHGPATEAENGPVLVTLCGNPVPGVFATCNFNSSNGEMLIEGYLTSGLLAQWGLPVSMLTSYLDSSMVYVNVHTAMNPAGEVRGQLNPR